MSAASDSPEHPPASSVVGGPSPRRTFVCLSSQRWSDAMWTNKQHVMSRLAREHRVIYVDFGTRPLVEILRRRLRSSACALQSVLDAAGSGWGARLDPLAPVVEERDGVTVLDFPIPRFAEHLPHGSRVRAAVELDLRTLALGRWLKAQSIGDAVIWVYHPGFGGRVASLPSSRIVYDCVDEYTAFPEFRGAEAWIAARERDLCAVADAVFCTSRPLFEAKQALAPGRVHLVPNVADAAHFERAADPALPLPRDVAHLPRPMIGFVGAVSDYKVDLAWVAHLARQRPTWSVVLVGPHAVADPTTDLSGLRAVPNVHLVGYRPYAALPAYLKAFDAIVIPYRLGAATRGIFPLKFFESLASGRPVVISRLPALEMYYADVLVAEDAESFVDACAAAVAGKDDAAARDRRVGLARRNTWESRIAQMLHRLDELDTLDRPRGRPCPAL